MTRILCLRPSVDECEFEPLIACCRRFGPLVGIEASSSPACLLLDLTDVAHLFGGEAPLVERLLHDIAALGQRARAAVADTIGAAWAVANFPGRRGEGGEGKNLTLGIPATVERTPFSLSPPPPSTFRPPPFLLVPPGETRRWLRPLPIEALRLPGPNVAGLHSLGLWRIEQLEPIPRREWLSRFGPHLLEHWDRAMGQRDEPMPACELPPRFAAGWSPEYPTARRETIEAALEHLTQQVAKRLRVDGRGAMQLQCRLECDRSVPLLLSIGLFHPSAAPKHLAQLLQVRLERVRLAAPVRRIDVEAIRTAPLELRQQELFADEPPRRHPRHLADLIDRLSNRLGPDMVTRVRWIPDAQPELACRYVPMVEGRRSPRALLRDLPLRPARLLTPPVPLTGDCPHFRGSQHQMASVDRQGRENRPVPFGAISQFEFFGCWHRVAQSWGPERIETGWWRGQTIGRDYYCVETTTGQRFWLFQQLHDHHWFLHGTFE